MIDLRPSAVLRAALILLSGLSVLGLAAVLALRVWPVAGGAVPPAAPPLSIWVPADGPPQVALADEAPLPRAQPMARSPVAPRVPDQPPGPGQPPALALAPDPEPRLLAPRPAVLPRPVAPGPQLGDVPPPPRRPGAAPLPPAEAPPPGIATRRATPEGVIAPPLDWPGLASLVPQSDGAPRQSPLPQPRPQTTPQARATVEGGAVAARLDPPPRRPLRLAAPRVAPQPAVPASLPPAPPPLASLGDGPCGPTLARAIPARPRGAAAGQATLATLRGTGGTARDAALERAVAQGNIPDHLRRLVPVTLSGTLPDGRRSRVVICVMPDYLAVGEDRDFVRIPLGLPAANRLAERFDMLLPTTRMVDAIHAQAQVRLSPAPMAPGPQMASTDYLLAHDRTVEQQRRATGAALGALVAGHKKDLVLSHRLARMAGRVAIYGWHRANGQPIQPLSTVHGQTYADYSHGIRLVSRIAWVDGRAVDLHDLLGDRRMASILTDPEGPIATRQILAAMR